MFSRVSRARHGQAKPREWGSRKDRRDGDPTAELGEVDGVDAASRRAPWQGPVETARPPEWVPPPKEWQEAAARLSGEGELLVDGWLALSQAKAGVRDPGGSTTDALVPWELYTSYTKMALQAGYVFAIGDDGKATIQTAEPVDFQVDGRGIDNSGLYREAEARAWKDGQILSLLLVGGADQSASTPKVCVFTRNSATVIEHEAEVEIKVSAEEAKGFVRRTKGSTTMPTVWRRLNLVAQGAKKRFAINRTAPRDL